jgi:hypothetical protein
MHHYEKYFDVIFVAKPRGEIEKLLYLGSDGIIILNWILGKQIMALWIELSWLRTGSSGILFLCCVFFVI